MSTNDCYLSLNLLTVHCGILGVFHSLFEFIKRFLGVRSIRNPSVICRFVESRWYVPVTSILKFTFLPPCTMLQWSVNIDFELLL